MSAMRIAVALSLVSIAACGGSSDSGVGSDASTSAIRDSGADKTDDGSGDGSASDDSGGDDSGLPQPVIGADGGLVIPDDDASVDPPDGSRGGVTTPPRGTDGGPGQIACNGKTCDSATQVCCLGAGPRATCTATADCRTDAFACTGTNSCTTGVCCEEVTRTTVGSKCEAKCPAGGLQLCTTNGDCTGADEECVKAGGLQSCRVPWSRPDAGIFPQRDGGGGFMRPDGG